jgi:hypothetical protein
VLIERPGSKRARRCEAVIGLPTGVPGSDLDSFSLLLEDALVWDGFLFAGSGDLGPQFVWHVVNGDLFPLAAQHGQSILLYVEELRPAGWSEDDLIRVVDAPSLSV